MALKDVKGVIGYFWKDVKEEFRSMDRKLVKIGGGIVGFLVAGAVYFFFFQNFLPF
jgi:hypothetical protein